MTTPEVPENSDGVTTTSSSISFKAQKSSGKSFTTSKAPTTTEGASSSEALATHEARPTTIEVEASKKKKKKKKKHTQKVHSAATF